MVSKGIPSCNTQIKQDRSLEFQNNEKWFKKEHLYDRRRDGIWWGLRHH